MTDHTERVVGFTVKYNVAATLTFAVIRVDRLAAQRGGCRQVDVSFKVYVARKFDHAN